MALVGFLRRFDGHDPLLELSSSLFFHGPGFPGYTPGLFSIGFPAKKHLALFGPAYRRLRFEPSIEGDFPKLVLDPTLLDVPGHSPRAGLGDPLPSTGLSFFDTDGVKNP